MSDDGKAGLGHRVDRRMFFVGGAMLAASAPASVGACKTPKTRPCR